jgi:hypothetical protein
MEKPSSDGFLVDNGGLADGRRQAVSLKGKLGVTSI